MNRLILIAAAAVLASPFTAHAQTAPTYQGQDGQTKEAVGTFCVGTSCSSGGGTATDPATGTNQSAQLTQEQLTAARLGDTTSPAAGTVNARLALILAATGFVQGNVAGGVTDAGNPVKVGCVVNTLPPTYAAGQRGDCQADTRGSIRMLIASANSAANVGVTTNPVDGINGSSVTALHVYSFNAIYNSGSGTWSVARGDTNGAYVIPKGGASIATNQISVGTTATLIAAARTGRQKISVTVTTAVQCAFGPAGVTLATGWPLAAVAYAADTWDTAAALYGVCASAATVAEREQF